MSTTVTSHLRPGCTRCTRPPQWWERSPRQGWAGVVGLSEGAPRGRSIPGHPGRRRPDWQGGQPHPAGAGVHGPTGRPGAGGAGGRQQRVCRRLCPAGPGGKPEGGGLRQRDPHGAAGPAGTMRRLRPRTESASPWSPGAPGRRDPAHHPGGQPQQRAGGPQETAQGGRPGGHHWPGAICGEAGPPPFGRGRPSRGSAVWPPDTVRRWTPSSRGVTPVELVGGCAR